MNWNEERVVPTGGVGFLGSYVLEKLAERGCTHVLVPRSRECDLVEMSAVKRLYRDARPTMVLHLAELVWSMVDSDFESARLEQRARR